MKRRLFLTAIVGSSASTRGVAYLSKRQNPDGSWTSNTYGLLRSGQSLTPFVLNALLDAGVPSTDARLTKALAFLLPHLIEEGDYPCYANALASTTRKTAGPKQTPPSAPGASAANPAARRTPATSTCP